MTGSRSYVFLAACFSLILVVGWAARADTSDKTLPNIGTVQVGKVTYVPPETKRDGGIERMLKKEYGHDYLKGARYWYNHVHLTSPTQTEVFVMAYGAGMSGTGGYSGLLLGVKGDKYVKLGRFYLVRPPVLISDHKTDGWSDIVFHVSGGGLPPGYVFCTWNGKSYDQGQPTHEAATLNGTAILSHDVQPNYGVLIH